MIEAIIIPYFKTKGINVNKLALFFFFWKLIVTVFSVRPLPVP